MPQPFCQLEPESEIERQWVAAVVGRQYQTVDALLSGYAELCRKIDTHWFAFDSPAIVAAKQDEAMVKILLRHGADINQRSSWWAGSFGVLDGVSAETASFLVKRGARFDIHSAAEQGECELVAEFLEQDPSRVNARGGDGQTPLHTASTIEIVDRLLDAGANGCLDHSATAAQYAVTDPEKCRHLLIRGATPDIFMACALGDRELVEVLIRSDPACLQSRIGECELTSPVDVRSHHHIYYWKLLGTQTPLEVAESFDQREIWHVLFERSSPEQQFLASCWKGDQPTAAALVQQNPGLVRCLGHDDARLLARAAWEGRLEAVRTMLEVGFDPHLKGAEDSTPLDRAAFHGEREIVELLLQHDPAPPLTEQNKYGGVPLDCCAYGATHSWKQQQNDHLGTAKALLAAGASIDPGWLPIADEAIDQLFREHLGIG